MFQITSIHPTFSRISLSKPFATAIPESMYEFEEVLELKLRLPDE